MGQASNKSKTVRECVKQEVTWLWRVQSWCRWMGRDALQVSKKGEGRFNPVQEKWPKVEQERMNTLKSDPLRDLKTPEAKVIREVWIIWCYSRQCGLELGIGKTPWLPRPTPILDSSFWICFLLPIRAICSASSSLFCKSLIVCPILLLIFSKWALASWSFFSSSDMFAT